MSELFKADSIYVYNQWAGVDTLHPLAGFIDFSKVEPLYNTRKIYGFYAVFLKDVNCGDLRYGRQYYDYQDGTLLFVAPGQVFGAEDDGIKRQPTGYLLMFHPDLIRNTSLGKIMRDYTFFSYATNEALHINKEERQVVMDCFNKIQYELKHPVDKYSKHLMVDSIKMLLDYCTRFYDRQFITHENVNQDILIKLEQLLDEYFSKGAALQDGIPNVQYCADKLCMSPNYLSDILKKTTGSTALRYIHDKVIELAKTELVSTDKTINEISYHLGFQYSQHFARLFKREVGITPKEYREQCQ